jgi:hypothetical protein
LWSRNDESPLLNNLVGPKSQPFNLIPHTGKRTQKAEHSKYLELVILKFLPLVLLIFG